MATGQLRRCLKRVYRAALAHEGGIEGAGATDADLLDRYVARREEAAFAALVQRHGPMVLGVCRRVLRHDADAEDAFQAAFLVLARKAAAVVPRAMLGNWLHGVAYRTALKARAMRHKRQARERSERPERSARPDRRCPASDRALDHLQEVLDAELDRLPRPQRAAVVLCDLEGRSLKEAAGQLAIPLGTLASRLARGRRRLARRLTQRGLALSGGSLAVMLAQQSAAAVMAPPLFIATVQAARDFAGAAACHNVASNVLALAHGVIRAMLLTRLKLAALVAIMIVLLGAGICLMVPIVPAAPPSGEQKNATPKQAREKVESLPSCTVLKCGQWVNSVAWSPDGLTLATITWEMEADGGSRASALMLWDVRTGLTRQTLEVIESRPFRLSKVVFSPDGKTLATTADGVKGSDLAGEVKLWSADGGALKHAFSFDRHLCCAAFTPDAQRIAAGGIFHHTIRLWHCQTGVLLRSLDVPGMVRATAFADDGKTLALGLSPGRKEDKTGVVLLNVETGEIRKELTDPDDRAVYSVAISPDGKRLAYGGDSRTARLWDLAAGKLIQPLSHDTVVFAVAFSPNGRLLVTSGGDKVIRVWDAHTGEPKQTLEGHTARVNSLAFQRDGRLASGSADQTIRLWTWPHHKTKVEH